MAAGSHGVARRRPPSARPALPLRFRIRRAAEPKACTGDAGTSRPATWRLGKAALRSHRNAVILRDRKCRWAGGCNQPAAACEVHHTKHKADGGKTSTRDCVLLCTYHHQIAIHRQGWTLVLNPDGTTTAWNKDKTKVLHSHGPPARAG